MDEEAEPVMCPCGAKLESECCEAPSNLPDCIQAPDELDRWVWDEAAYAANEEEGAREDAGRD